LVARKGSGQKVKNVMDRLVSMGRKEALEHRTVQRPWGSFTAILESEGYKVKQIVINAGEKLSLQFHKHRAEHWTVVRGRAKISISDTVGFFNENESVNIPLSAIHRVENCELTPLEIIEIQYGDYLEEDDIVRIEDIYGRTGG
jgi:mannose-1-phosphate guanylyltransferase / mannose-6-phosphate isomerase